MMIRLPFLWRAAGVPLALALAACVRHPLPAPPAPVAGPAAAPAPVDAPAAGPVAAEDLAYLRERQLMVPVEGVRAERVPDSYAAPRGGGRRHNAVDILAPRGTPVLSADDGRVLKLRRNAAGGITVYAVDPEERFVYYYAHLDRYRAALTEGTRLAKGDVIGYVGTTGNAPPGTPHLHFQVMRLRTVRRWWDGVPVNPLPFLMLSGAARGDADGETPSEPPAARQQSGRYQR